MRVTMGAVLVLCLAAVGSPAETLSVDSYESIQAAIDANPGKVLHIPSGEYSIDKAIRITTDGSGLSGRGRIVQTNSDAPIVEIYRAGEVLSGARIIGLELTRPEGSQDTRHHAILASECRDLDILDVRVIDNHSQAAAIQLQRCSGCRVAGCTVINYKRVGVDDRTESPLYGYAFRVIDGTGIAVERSVGVQVQHNRVIERNIFPTPEMKSKHRLGAFTGGKEPMKRGSLAPPEDYANNWHQGSAIIVTAPEESDHVLVTGNYIENAAQGIDIHADHVTCSNNSIHCAFLAIKCMHGSRNVLISDNVISHYDLWGIVMMPGTASRPGNVTGGNIISGNILSDFGHGHEYYNWKDACGRGISLESGPLPENPPMADVLITGNVVHDSGHGQEDDGAPEPPRYEYAVYITPEPAPRNLVFADNIFHPGSEGVSNVPLPGN